MAGGAGSVSLRWVPIRHGAVRQVRLVWLCFVSFSNGTAGLVEVWQVRQVWVRWDKLGFGTARFGKAGPVRCVCVRRVVLRQAPSR